MLEDSSSLAKNQSDQLITKYLLDDNFEYWDGIFSNQNVDRDESTVIDRYTFDSRLTKLIWRLAEGFLDPNKPLSFILNALIEERVDIVFNLIYFCLIRIGYIGWPRLITLFKVMNDRDRR